MQEWHSNSNPIHCQQPIIDLSLNSHAGRLIADLVRNDPYTIACHEKGGVHVIREASTLAGPQELVLLGKALFPRVTELGYNKYGVHCACKLTSNLVSSRSRV